MAFLEVNDIKKSFGKNEILKGISFDLQKGEVLSIIGSSGSGKTTLLRCINFLEFAESGTITVNGEMIYDGVVDKKIKEKDLRKKRLHFGLVFQDFNLFPQYTALENVTLARRLLANSERTGETPEAIRREGEALLEQMGLGDRMGHYPHQLSGGMLQRAMIAAAIVNRPKLLLLDEPVSGLDPKVTGEMYGLIQRLNREDGVTILMISHDITATLTYASHILHLGRRVFFGTKADYLREFPQAWKGGEAL